MSLTAEATNAIARVTARYGDNPSDETLTDALADLFVYLLANETNERWELVEAARIHAWAEIEGDEFTT